MNEETTQALDQDTYQSSDNGGGGPRTYKNSVHTITLNDSKEDYCFEKKIKQDTMAIYLNQQHTGLKKRKFPEKELPPITKGVKGLGEIRSLKQSNQTYLLQLVSNQDLDQLKTLIHKSI